MMRNKLLFAKIAIVVFLSYWIVIKYFSQERHFENLGLGEETVTYWAADSQGNTIHISTIDDSSETKFVDGWEKRGKKPVLLILGNSQTHSINQKKSAEVTYVELLHKNNSAAEYGIDVIANSYPNASLQDFYISYMYWKERMPLKAVVVPVFMDDLREVNGIEDGFYPNLTEHKFLIKDSSDYLVKDIDAAFISQWQAKNNDAIAKPDNPEMAALKETFQERTETWLNMELDKNVPAWRNRTNIRGEFFSWLYQARNAVLRINASTIRAMIPQRYDYNLHALNLLIEDCVRSGIKLILYIPPIRSDIPIPYDMKGYQKLKSTIESFAGKYPKHLFYGNFEKIVPGDMWGYKNSTSLKKEKEVDFMHFKFRGHQILADSLQPLINSSFRYL